MAEPTPPGTAPYTIVVGIDFCEAGDLALLEAWRISRAHSASRRLVVHVARAYGPMLQLDLPDDLKTVNASEAQGFLEAYVQEKTRSLCPTDTAGPFECHLRTGRPANELAELARSEQAELVVVGNNSRRTVSRVLLGSVAEATVRRCPCSVLVVRAQTSDFTHDERYR